VRIDGRAGDGPSSAGDRANIANVLKLRVVLSLVRAGVPGSDGAIVLLKFSALLGVGPGEGVQVSGRIFRSRRVAP